MKDIKIADKVSKTQFSLFMRQLHILALVQHSSSAENMNCSTMAGLLSLEPGKDDVTEKMIRDSVSRLIEMGFPVQMEKGALRVLLERELTPEDMLEVLPYYINVVSDTVGIRDCFKSYVDNHSSRSLWIIARIYFASLQKKSIELAYRSKYKTETEIFTLNPYRWIYRGEAVYLVARNVEKSTPALFRLNRIKDLHVTDRAFDDEIPSSGELLRYSMGAFISSDRYNVCLRFKPEEKENIEEDFGHLNLNFAQSAGDSFMYVDFSVCDLINVCKAVFSYSGRVKILKPKEAVDVMKKMMDGNSNSF